MTNDASVYFIAALLGLLGSACVGCGPTGHWRPRDFYSDPDVIALVQAAEKGDRDAIDRLVSRGVNVNAEGKDGMTPLLWAMWAKNKQGFLCLLEHGADPNRQIHFAGPTRNPDEGFSVTNYAARAENDSEWLELVLKHGANPNLIMPDVAKTTPIFDAIDSRKIEHVKMLIKAGADLNYQTALGTTPAMYAALNRWFNAEYLFLDAGADYRIKDKDGRDLVYYMTQARPDQLLPDTLHARDKVCKFLEEKGVDVKPLKDQAAEFNAGRKRGHH